VKTATILYLCIAVTAFAGASEAITWCLRAYATHFAMTRVDFTVSQRAGLDRAFDQQVSAASGGAMIVLFQLVAIYYARKLKREAGRAT
jgi:hypothetical protein